MVLMVETSKRLFWQAIHVWICSGIAGTALRRQGRSVARAAGPRHRRPRLRHRIHRRGEASAASNPTNSRMSRQTGRPVGAAVGGPVRAATLTRTLRGCTAPTLRWAARRYSGPPSARQRARTAAALCPCRGCLPPRNPLQGTLRIAYAPAGSAAVPLLSRVLCGLSSLLVSVWNVLPQGSCVKAWPRCVLQQDGHRCLAASTGKRACQTGRSVADAVLAQAGGQRGGSVPPHPSPVAALRGCTNSLLL